MIYVHVPFCASHCTYCAFYSELLHSRRVKGSDAVCAARALDDYVEALCREIEEEGAAGGVAFTGPDTLYFGGGTPSLLSVGQVGRVLDALRHSGLIAGIPEEFTFEVNPEDIVEKGHGYALGLRKVGVNRISMGVQSFDDAILRRMGRRHRNAGSREAYRILREAGFDNISIDLIFGFGKDSEVATLTDALREFSDGGNIGGDISAVDNDVGKGLPEHISCYQLSVEEGSGLGKMLDRGLWSLPQDDECAQRYDALCGILACLGYEHYEISNWALPGRRSRHNSAYWKHLPYLGFGPGAHSLFVGGKPVRHVRRWNNPDLAGWCAAACSGTLEEVRGEETLTPEQLAEERLFLGLRTSEGIPSELLPRDMMEKALSEGSLVYEDPGHPASAGPGRLRIPEDKWFVSDNIIQSLI